MSTDKPDPLLESLMQLAVSAAPLIRRARESGIFTAPPPAPVATPAPEAAGETPPADVAALQQIIVNQALRIAALEAEITALKAKRKKPA
jgi:hypothetical protein